MYDTLEQTKYSYFHNARGIKRLIKPREMSFFSTIDILKSLMTKELINSVVECDEFKSVLTDFDFDKYVSK